MGWAALVGAGLGLWGASKTASAANKATQQQQQMTDYEKQLFEQYGRPQLDLELQRMRQQQPYQQYLQNLTSGMVGGPQTTSQPMSRDEWLYQTYGGDRRYSQS